LIETIECGVCSCMRDYVSASFSYDEIRRVLLERERRVFRATMESV
jgi:hypothetical protein